MTVKENNTTEILQHKISWFLRGDSAHDSLDEASEERIKKCIKEGYNQGELCAMSEDRESELRGWWSIKND